MKNKFLFVMGLLLASFIIHMNATAQQVTPVKVGQVYYMFDDSLGRNAYYMTYGPSDTLKIHDTVTKVVLIHDTTKVLVFFTDTIRIHDTIAPPVPPVLTGIFTTQTLPTSSGNDGNGGIEVGMKFRSTVQGYIRGIRFYKVAGNTGTHTGELYNGVGVRIASAVFTETASGWQTVTFPVPMAIAANVTYVAAVFSASGNYSNTASVFGTAITHAPLIALADGTDGVNGVYKYSAAPVFPTNGYQKSNYWVEPIYSDK